MTTIARTGLGTLQGASEGAVVAFRGVAYAAPPTGDRRFAPPVAASPWTGVRDATHDGPIAPQAPSRLRDAMGDFTAPQHEDCLTLTIWTPGVDAAARPVLVWLHGGAWSSGAGSLAWYDGGRLAGEQDVVVVGVNYRLGALGYLHAPGISPGNLGTMDQVLALRWVRDHIAAFGGDPARVTVGGQSAGAASIGRMIADPTARTLFRAAILQSGGFGRPPLSREEAVEIGRDYVRLVGIDPAAKDAAALMRAVPIAQLIAAQGALARSRARFAETTPPFMPLVDTPMTEAALLDMIAAGVGDLAVLIGSTRDEVHAFYAANPAMAEPPEDAVRSRFAALAGSADAIEAYRRRRPGGAAMDLLADLGTDHTFGWPSLRLADAIAARGGHVHAYRFDWAPPRSPFKACHCIELPFSFGTLDAWHDAAMLRGGDPAQMAPLSAMLRAHWGHFVRAGAPGPSWPRYDGQARLTMLFDEVCGVVGDPSGMGWRA
jgi:para-nitrobenzyl esterase